MNKKKKVVAVIPARSGSKGIPNKNIRLIGARPLIAYTIENALKSLYVSDVIVTTDSPVVALIANQMGVRVHNRPKELCGDEVTLDGVIYDVVKDIECDVVVTLQPTSPTLKSGTLDNAIEQLFQREKDTIISVNNRPHLAWIVDNAGKKVPAYKKRLNRQFLPPYYFETGAFLISRRDVVTKDTRIGANVDVFEISAEESLDIDDFSDLVAATMIIEQHKVAFYVGGNREENVYRILELADEFYTKPDIYYDKNNTNPDIFGSTTHNLIPVDGMSDLLVKLQVNQYSLLINGIFDTTIDYMIAIRSALPEAKIVNFEDGGEGAPYADIVFNTLFKAKCGENQKYGEKYYIAPKKLMFYNPIQIKDAVKHIFISFGDADTHNHLERILKIIKTDKYKNVNFHIVLGRENVDIVDLLREHNNIEILHSKNNIQQVMSKCDIGVISSGNIAYELAMFGMPSIVIAQNQREACHDFVCEENGFSYLGLTPSDQLIEHTLDFYIAMSKGERLRHHKMLVSHDLRNGRSRVIKLINSL